VSTPTHIQPSRRWLIYSLVGTLFGVVDWYVPNVRFLVAEGLWAHPAIAFFGLVFVWGVWLVPALPIAVYETRVSQRMWSAAGAVVATWLVALTSYYLFYACLLAFVGLHQMELLHISAWHDPYFGQYWRDAFPSLILDQWLEWSPVALIGGTIVGWSTSWLYRLWFSRRYALARSTD
jgi:hypothetical protein